MVNVVPFSNWTREVQEDVIKTIKNALARAERGEINGVGIAESKINGEIGTSFSKTNNWPALLGATTTLERRIGLIGDEEDED